MAERANGKGEEVRIQGIELRDSKWLRLSAIAFITDMIGAVLLFIAGPDPAGLPYKFAFWPLFGLTILGIIGLLGFTAQVIAGLGEEQRP